MNTELVVPYNKNNQQLVLETMPRAIAFWSCIFGLSLLLRFILNYYVAIVIQGILLSFMVPLVLTYIYTRLQSKNDTPAAILNQKGIWINNWGFVSWGNVEEISIYSVQLSESAHVEALGIRLKSLAPFFKQASFSGRFGIFWPWLFGYHYHISLESNSQIIAFSKQFIK